MNKSKTKTTKRTPKKTTKGQVNTNKPFSYHLGNLLIILSALLLFLGFYPLIGIYVTPPKITKVESLKGDYISISKIHAQAPIIFNVDPYNEPVYKKILEKGVAQAKGTSLPGQKGTVFIFAHSSGNPLEVTSYNTIFFRLGELKKNDLIEIKKDKKIYKYRVVDQKIVSPTDIKYLKETKNQLILQTCWPIGTSLKRLLIFAVPTN